MDPFVSPIRIYFPSSPNCEFFKVLSWLLRSELDSLGQPFFPPSEPSRNLSRLSCHQLQKYHICVSRGASSAGWM